jgi:hypothetical protein
MWCFGWGKATTDEIKAVAHRIFQSLLYIIAMVEYIQWNRESQRMAFFL